jgi:hypothetical protein
MAAVVRGDGRERRFERPFDPEVAREVLSALGIQVRYVSKCWLVRHERLGRCHAVAAVTTETWRVDDVDTGVPVEKVYYLQPREDGWACVASSWVMPMEWEWLDDAKAEAERQRAAGAKTRKVPEDVHAEVLDEILAWFSQHRGVMRKW